MCEKQGCLRSWGMTEPEQQFRAGDRVQLIRAFDGIAAGTYGTILTQFTLQHLYDVRFDGHTTPRIVEGRYLAPAPPMS
jgi:hypothetical protein